jgi:diadenylate cyclase
MNFFQSFVESTMYFRLTSLTMVEIIDLALVTITFYLLLGFGQQSRAAILIRGVLILSGVLFVISILLPLPAFDWLVRGLLLAILIATPITFQPELRRVLERIGRSAGMTRDVQRTMVDQLTRRLVRAVNNMSASRTGALIVLEGSMSLQEIAETGIAINGKVTSELLQAIFYPSNPLHDGAVILREDEVVAASCVLPLTQRPLPAPRRLGTRHRAAVGLSEHSDALIIVVSEETGHISAAHESALHRPLDVTALQKHLLEFYNPEQSTAATLTIWDLFGQLRQQLWPHPTQSAPRRFFSNIGYLVIALLLAWATWTFVIRQTNPATRLRFEDVPLHVNNAPPGTTLVTDPPDTIAAVIETTDVVRPTLSSNSFQGVVSLEDLGPGLHHLPIQVNSGASPVRVLSVDPPVLDLELAPIVTQTAPVVVEFTGQQNLSRAYQVVGTPLAEPAQVQIKGAKSLVDQVSLVQARISLANATTTLEELRPLRALDAAGREIMGVTLDPTEAQITVAVQRRVNARDVGVRVITQGSPESGYWVSGLSVTPSNVTLQGEPEQLAGMENFVDTLPVDVSGAVGDLTLPIPLDLPADVEALDNSGNPAKTVTAQIKISPRRSSLLVMRPVELLGIPATGIVRVRPSSVELLLNGPLPTLNAIEANPELVQVAVDATALEAGEDTKLPLQVVVPENVQYQVLPDSVSVNLP